MIPMILLGFYFQCNQCHLFPCVFLSFKNVRNSIHFAIGFFCGISLDRKRFFFVTSKSDIERRIPYRCFLRSDLKRIYKQTNHNSISQMPLDWKAPIYLVSWNKNHFRWKYSSFFFWLKNCSIQLEAVYVLDETAFHTKYSPREDREKDEKTERKKLFVLLFFLCVLCYVCAFTTVVDVLYQLPVASSNEQMRAVFVQSPGINFILNGMTEK